MKIIKKKKKANTSDFCSKKDRIFRQLALLLKQSGLEVRREQLKFGSGWRALSGLCAHENKNLLFVDSRLSQDEQIDLLRSKARELNIEIQQ